MSDITGEEDGGAFFRRLATRLADAVPHPAAILGLGMYWGLSMAISAFVALFLRLGFDIITPVPTIFLFFCGGAVAAPLAFFTARLLLGRSKKAFGRMVFEFFVFAVLLVLATLALTAFLFAVQYRLYYSQWHAPFGTITWMFQFVFTSASAAYQFAVFGARLYWPLAPVFLFVFSLWFVRRSH